MYADAINVERMSGLTSSDLTYHSPPCYAPDLLFSPKISSFICRTLDQELAGRRKQTAQDEGNREVCCK